MKRIIDILISSALIVLMTFPMLLVYILIRIDSRGPGLYWSERVGKNNVNFMMPKFRTMHEGTTSVATHLLDDPSNHLTRLGNMLRRTSIDELPQLYSILRGQMTFVGPRPALFNQNDLIRFRTKNNIQSLLPGVTGWAQINGRDNISIQEKVMFDLEYLEKKSVLFDLHIILLTLLKVLKKEDVSH
ncbi:sugar transferase [SAR86 cluster bacterium]|nr:sugar transferase [SAR86 cluster bacterium]